MNRANAYFDRIPEPWRIIIFTLSMLAVLEIDNFTTRNTHAVAAIIFAVVVIPRLFYKRNS